MGCSIHRDNGNKKNLADDSYTQANKDNIRRNMPLDERLKIEAVVDNYFTKRKMNKSHCTKIAKAIAEGAVRGALGGIVIDATIGNIANSAATFGVINGLMKIFTLHNPKNNFILQNSYT